MSGRNPHFNLKGTSLSKANEALIREYLDIVANAPEDLERTLKILTDNCVWRIMPPGIDFTGKDQLRSFVKLAMGSRSHNAKYGIEIRNCFTDGEYLCVEYFHGAIATRFHIKVVENVCLVCHMRDGKFDRIHEYVDTSGSRLVGFGLKLLPFITKGKKSKPESGK
jgi:ketosteroid isomerase-like protein